MEYLAVTDLEILNRNNEATFQNVFRCLIMLCFRNLVPKVVQVGRSHLSPPFPITGRLSSSLPM